MYVCICNAVTDHEIREARDRGIRTLERLREETGVASCCGACEPEAQAILAEHTPPGNRTRYQLHSV